MDRAGTCGAVGKKQRVMNIAMFLLGQENTQAQDCKSLPPSLAKERPPVWKVSARSQSGF
jgi:hypothetical protein